MLIIHSDTEILVTLNEDDESLTGEHIKNGYSGMLEEWKAGIVSATKLGNAPMDKLIMDAGKPRLMTDEEIKKRTVELEADITAQKEKQVYEAKIKQEIRDMAINSLNAKEVK